METHRKDVLNVYIDKINIWMSLDCILFTDAKSKGFILAERNFKVIQKNSVIVDLQRSGAAVVA